MLLLLTTILLLGSRQFMLAFLSPDPEDQAAAPPAAAPVPRPAPRPLTQGLAVSLVLGVAVVVRLVLTPAPGGPAPRPDFLQGLAVPAAERQVTEQALTPVEVATLKPDSALVREYRRPTEPPVQLLVVAGSRPESVHSPRSCLAGGGWERLTDDVVNLPLAQGKLATNRTLLSQGRDQLLVTYFFTDGHYSTPHLASFQAYSLLQRLRARVPLHALVRVAVPVAGDARAAARLSDEFAQSALPAVLQRLREAQKLQ